ncbi:CTD small phosphatase-like protein 2-A [Sycon ciliatum]|uniref:CTD small phosphatase-like protein 2-A n=1 Tax=Sycon ciliatum TaxID=27933 RepID=UPI0031F707E5
MGNHIPMVQESLSWNKAELDGNKAIVMPAVRRGFLQNILATVRSVRLTLRAAVHDILTTSESNAENQRVGKGTDNLFCCVDFIPGIPICAEKFWNTSLLPPLSRHSTASPKYTLALDLDETLVHSTSFRIAKTANLDSTVIDCYGEKVHVYERPFLTYFLLRASEHFDIVVYTTMEKPYALKMVTWINRDFRLVKYLLRFTPKTADHCVQQESRYIKCLQMLGRDLRKTILVDSSPTQLAYNGRNGIHIDEWHGCHKDRALLELCKYLHDLVICHPDDVRPFVEGRAMGKVLYRLYHVADLEAD